MTKATQPVLAKWSSPLVRRSAARVVVAACRRNGERVDPRIEAIAQGSELVDGEPMEPLAKWSSPLVRQSAARLIVTARRRNGEPVDPRIEAIARASELHDTTPDHRVR